MLDSFLSVDPYFRAYRLNIGRLKIKGKIKGDAALYLFYSEIIQLFMSDPTNSTL